MSEEYKLEEEVLYGNKEIIINEISEILNNNINNKDLAEGLIAIDGSWGIGKSFVIEQIANLQTNNNKSVLIVNTWELESVDNLFEMIKISLISADRKADKNIEKLLKKYAGYDIFNKIFFSGLSFVDIIATGRISKGMELANKSKKTLSYEMQKKVDEYDENITLLKDMKGFNINYIFIDELERILPDMSLEILKTVKFLNKNIKDIPKFIVSSNFLQLENSLHKLYGNQYNVHGYFDKLFTKTYTINSDKNHIVEYLKKQIMNQMGYEIDIELNYFINDAILPTVTFREVELLLRDYGVNNVYKICQMDHKKSNVLLSVLFLKYKENSDFNILVNSKNNSDIFDVFYKYKIAYLTTPSTISRKIPDYEKPFDYFYKKLCETLTDIINSNFDESKLKDFDDSKFIYEYSTYDSYK